MHASQRGSVLLTVIAGILILAVVGTAALSLMTGSVMTVVDGRETVQAAYLAESGKEIVRAQTASKSGGALMEAAISLSEPQEDDGKKFVVDGAGSVKTRLYPSWYRVHGSQWETTSFGWYGGAPAGDREWLAMSSAGAYRYEAQAGVTALGAAAADVYLIGRVDGTPDYRASSRELRVQAKKVKENDKDDFSYFPKSGGLIGLVAQGKSKDGEEVKRETTTVSDIRFLYDTLEKQGNSYIFSNVTPFPENVGPETITAALKGHDVALGQYFRVECESVTDYGARSALVWHTNGRNSLRFAGSVSSEGIALGGGTASVLTDLFGGKVENGKPKDEGLVKGDNIMGNLRVEKDDDDDDDEPDYHLEWKFEKISGSNKGKMKVNHFLRQDDTGSNQEYWWVAVASPWLAYGNSTPLYSKMQYSFEPDDDDENYFTGILCRLAFVNSFTPPKVSSVGTVQQGKGARGIGVGVMQGEITFHNDKDEVKTASVNPALLPGFRYEKSGNDDKDKNNDKGVFTISADDRAKWYGPNGLLRYRSVRANRGNDREEDKDVRITLYPLLVVWAYDDLEENEGLQVQSLRPLAVAVLEKSDYLKLEYEDENKKEVNLYLSLTVEVEEKDGKNHLKIWLEKNRESLIKGASIPQWPTSGQNLVSGWVYTADEEVSTGTDGPLSTSLSIAFATGEAYRRVGIFSEVYPFGSQNRGYADIVLGNFFFTGTGSGGGSLFPGGLTPGIVN